MRKFAKVAAVIAIAGLALTGCGAKPGPTPGDTENFSIETVTVGGEQFKCIFENKGYRAATMSCEKLDTKDGLGKNDTEDYTRDIVTVEGEKYDCLFRSRGFSEGTMSCEPLKK